jgi:hypothetical protein
VEQPQAARSHYEAAQRLSVATLAVARRAWARLELGAIDASWEALRPGLLLVLTAAQRRAVADAARYVPTVVAELGLDPTPSAQLRPEAFAGVASDGRPLVTLLEQPVITTKTLIAGGLSAPEAAARGASLLDSIVLTQVADAGRAGESAGMVATPAVGGYVRMLTTPSCSRCVILAGKWFRWNQGFQRHPRCDCRHIPASENISDDLTTSPIDYFRSLSNQEQDRVFGSAGAQAVRDGANISHVVNANATTYVAAGRRLPRNAVRPPPETIYARANGDRARALELLREAGYLT